MKTTFIAAALAACCAANVSAQTAAAGAGATSGSNSGAAAQSGAVNTVVIESAPYPTETTQHVVTSGGTTSTVNQNVSGSQTLRNTPNIAMSGPASGPCTGASGSLSVAAPGFGVGLNGATVDESCQDRETARIYAMMGERDMAMQMLYYSEPVARMRARKDAEAKHKQAASAAPAPVLVSATAPSDAELCMQARAKDDKPLAMRVCR